MDLDILNLLKKSGVPGVLGVPTCDKPIDTKATMEHFNWNTSKVEGVLGVPSSSTEHLEHLPKIRCSHSGVPLHSNNDNGFRDLEHLEHREHRKNQNNFLKEVAFKKIQLKKLVEQLGKYNGEDPEFLKVYIDDVINDWSHYLDKAINCFSLLLLKHQVKGLHV